MATAKQPAPVSGKTYVLFHAFSTIVFSLACWGAFILVTHWIALIIGAVGASILGVLGRLLEHDELLVKRHAFVNLTAPQWCYMTYRIAAGCGMAVAAAFLASSFLAPTGDYADLAPIAIGLVVAYLFDASKVLSR